MDQTDITKQIQQDLAIDETNLPAELQRQAGKFFFWSTLKAKATGKCRGSKAYLDTLKAEKGKEYKENMAQEDSKIRITERMLDDYLDMHEEIQTAKQALIDAQYQEEILDATVDAMRQRHYALIELARGRETERMIKNEYEQMKKDFEEREARKR